MSVEIKPLPILSNFVIGGAAGICASSVIHPLDLIKVRMQMSGIKGIQKEYKSAIHAFIYISRTEGPFALYNGLSAAIFRQSSYTAVRLGVFTNLKEYFKGANGDLSLFKNVAIALFSGGCGALVGNPAEVALVRMTNDGRLPKKEQRGYKNVFNALHRIVSEEGVLTLWRGCQPNIIRAITLNAVLPTTYTQMKQLFLSKNYFSDDIKCYVVASSISGFISTVVALPADIIKTRCQTVTLKQSYKQMIINIITQEGFLALWKGFTPCYLRLVPQSILFFIFLEHFQQLAQCFQRQTLTTPNFKYINISDKN